MRIHAALFLLLSFSADAVAAPQRYKAEDVEAGRLLYNDACAKCHAEDGKGVDKKILEIKTDVPDLGRCQDAGEETDHKWMLILRHGGPYIGLTEDMPSFELYSEEQRRQVLAYSRTFCKGNWVRGEVNFERPLFTEKAYPENEAVWSPRISRTRSGQTNVSVKSLIERRYTNRMQVEFAAPIEAHAETARGAGHWLGAGDVEAGVKYVVAYSLDRLFIASAGLDLVAPTGSARKSLGDGTWVAEPYLAFGKATGRVIVQGQVKGELPFNEKKKGREFAYRLDAGYRIRPDPRGLFPSVELLGDHANNLAIVPQFRWGISKTGKWAAALGTRIPVRGDKSEEFAVIGYLLWEYIGR